ncbi:DUF4913 domain-containing protein [Actinomadura keratinilytica]|jgi:hypothetical protein|uniref:DUF4913 domain-containing protein n=1 Tax=Actinomadura keratinilytica TaxID=547461 RepID=A0ABP7Z533_9ACTN
MTNSDDRQYAEDIADLKAQVKGLTTKVRELQEQLEQLIASGPAVPLTPPEATMAPPPAEAGSAEPHILSLEGAAFTRALEKLATWVDDYFIPAFVAGRPIKPNSPWCPEWWRHPEALTRLEALHRAFEELVTSPKATPSGHARWITDYVDPTLEQLRSPTGPFIRCTTDPDYPKHNAPQAFPLARFHRSSSNTD